jgi:hypothetical protein
MKCIKAKDGTIVRVTNDHAFLLTQCADPDWVYCKEVNVDKSVLEIVVDDLLESRVEWVSWLEDSQATLTQAQHHLEDAKAAIKKAENRVSAIKLEIQVLDEAIGNFNLKLQDATQ